MIESYMLEGRTFDIRTDHKPFGISIFAKSRKNVPTATLKIHYFMWLKLKTLPLTQFSASQP